MKTNKLFSGLLGLALGLGLTVSSWAAPAVVEKGSGVINDEYESIYIECFGELLQITAVIPYTYHRVQLPNGEFVYHDLYLRANIVGIGKDTGTVWTMEKITSPLIERSTGGGMIHTSSRDTWVSDTGERVEVRISFHLSFDANGNLRVDRFEVRCWDGN